jgi:cell division septation protein DedD
VSSTSASSAAIDHSRTKYAKRSAVNPSPVSPLPTRSKASRYPVTTRLGSLTLQSRRRSNRTTALTPSSSPRNSYNATPNTIRYGTFAVGA